MVAKLILCCQQPHTAMTWHRWHTPDSHYYQKPEKWSCEEVHCSKFTASNVFLLFNKLFGVKPLLPFTIPASHRSGGSQVFRKSGLKRTVLSLQAGVRFHPVVHWRGCWTGLTSWMGLFDSAPGSRPVTQHRFKRLWFGRHSTNFMDQNILPLACKWSHISRRWWISGSEQAIITAPNNTFPTYTI